MVKMVIALCLFLNGDLIEHRVQNSMSECLQKKRIATKIPKAVKLKRLKTKKQNAEKKANMLWLHFLVKYMG